MLFGKQNKELDEFAELLEGGVIALFKERGELDKMAIYQEPKDYSPMAWPGKYEWEKKRPVKVPPAE